MVSNGSQKVQPGLENSLGRTSKTLADFERNPFTINRAIFGLGIPDAFKVPLLAIVDHAQHGRTECTVSYQTLADEIRLARRNAMKAVKFLEGKRLIVILGLGGPKATNRIGLGPELLVAIQARALKEYDEWMKKHGVYARLVTQASPGSDAGVTPPSDAGVTQTSPLNGSGNDDRPTAVIATLSGEESRQGSEHAIPQGGSSPEGTPPAAPPPPAAAHDDEKVPVAVLDAIRAELGESVAAEVGRCHVQFRDACKGRWEVLIAAARDIGKSIKAGKPVSSPVGLLDSKTRKFVKEGVPADVAVRVAPQQNHNPSQPKCDPGPSIPREVAMQYIYESAGRPVPPQAKPDNRRIFTASPEQRARYEAEQAQYEAAQSARKPSHTPFPKATAEDEAWTRQREENLREKMRTKRQVESVAV